MSALQIAIETSSAPAESAMDHLGTFIEAHDKAYQASQPYADFENEVQTLMAAVECQLLAKELARYDLDVPLCLYNDKTYEHTGYQQRTYQTRAGDVTVRCSIYEHGLCPLELHAGIIKGFFTPETARISLVSVTHMPAGEAADFFQRMGRMMPSKSSLDRLSKDMSTQWESQRESFETALRAEEIIPEDAASVAVSLDGVMVPMRGVPASKRCKNRKSGYKEASCGTLSFFDDEGERLHTIRIARMPEPGKRTLKATLQEELTSIIKVRPDLKVVGLADGARDNWTFIGILLQGLVLHGLLCLDFFHAAGHLQKAFKEAYGKRDPMAQSEYEKYREILRDEEGGVKKVIQALEPLHKKHPRRKKLKRELNYFRRNRHRMKYAELQDQGLPIGSGIVEAACKTLVSQRLKQAGMRWSLHGGQAILTFRSLLQSKRFDRAFDRLAQFYKSTVSCPENIIPFPSSP